MMKNHFMFLYNRNRYGKNLLSDEFPCAEGRLLFVSNQFYINTTMYRYLKNNADIKAIIVLCDDTTWYWTGNDVATSMSEKPQPTSKRSNLSHPPRQILWNQQQMIIMNPKTIAGVRTPGEGFCIRCVLDEISLSHILFMHVIRHANLKFPTWRRHPHRTHSPFASYLTTTSA